MSSWRRWPKKEKWPGCSSAGSQLQPLVVRDPANLGFHQWNHWFPRDAFLETLEFPDALPSWQWILSTHCSLQGWCLEFASWPRLELCCGLGGWLDILEVAASQQVLSWRCLAYVYYIHVCIFSILLFLLDNRDIKQHLCCIPKLQFTLSRSFIHLQELLMNLKPRINASWTQNGYYV